MFNKFKLALYSAAVYAAIFVANSNLDACSLLVIYEPEPPQ